MKKLLLISLLLTSLSGFSQKFNPGLSGGIIGSTTSTGPEEFYPIIGLYGSFTLQNNLSEKMFLFHELAFEQKGASHDIFLTDKNGNPIVQKRERLSLNYLNLYPVLCGLKFGEHFKTFFGAYYSFLLNDKGGIDTGLTLGIEYEYDGAFVSLKGASTVLSDIYNGSYKNYGLMLGGGYRF